jgi:hypothetical protein
MTDNFFLEISSPETDRPPISVKILQYFEKFAIENILVKKKILLGTKWTIHVRFTILESGKRIPNTVHIISAFSTGLDKSYSVFIPSKLFIHLKDPRMKIIELFYQGLSVFFTENYKRVTNEFMDELWKKVDLEYLLSIPYPAPNDQVKYLY